MSAHRFAVLVDLRMPDINGLEVIRAIRDIDATCQVILMTAHATVETAIEALKLGARSVRVRL